MAGAVLPVCEVFGGEGPRGIPSDRMISFPLGHLCLFYPEASAYALLSPGTIFLHLLRLAKSCSSCHFLQEASSDC